jgi:ribosome-binding protein aMBF1 (putative translation factor)
MATRSRSKTFDELTPDQQAKVEALRARRNTPEAREAEIRDREAIREEQRTTGTVATTNDPAWPDDEIRLLKFLSGLKTKREQAGLSLAEVAERSGIDPPALSRLENGRGNPTARTLSRYCRAIGGRIVWGFEDTEDGR